jgi:hypothetical protein
MTGANGVLAWPTFESRLAAAADRVEQLDEQLRLARTHRDGIILEAVDAGMAQVPVARAVRLARSHVHRVIVNGYGS